MLQCLQHPILVQQFLRGVVLISHKLQHQFPWDHKFLSASFISKLHAQPGFLTIL